jgi:hypothetical protein
MFPVLWRFFGLIFWTDFLEEGPDGVIAPLVETDGCG